MTTIPTLTDRPRVLVAMIVYNGRDFVPRALTSASRLPAESKCQVDVLVLDDASPDEGWSDECAELCTDLGIQYYCTPRNVGIPRNMNLSLLRAESAGYDYVVVLNSDVIVPTNMVDQLVLAARSREKIATVMAWSNNVSIFSLPNSDHERYLTSTDYIDSISAELAAEFGTEAVHVPVGVGFCLCIPKEAIAEVGLMDPVFGRGYCEEVDWCRRAVERGWENVLAPSTFVYHIGSASTRLAGLLGPGEKTVHVHEDIIDQRHPDYRPEVEAWEATGAITDVINRGLLTLVRNAARTRGYVVDATWLRRAGGSPSSANVQGGVTVGPATGASGRGPGTGRVQITINPDGPASLVEAFVDGWNHPIAVGEDGILAAIADFVGQPAAVVRIWDRGRIAELLTAEGEKSGLNVQQLHRYPERV